MASCLFIMNCSLTTLTRFDDVIEFGVQYDVGGDLTGFRRMNLYPQDGLLHQLIRSNLRHVCCQIKGEKRLSFGVVFPRTFVWCWWSGRCSYWCIFRLENWDVVTEPEPVVVYVASHEIELVLIEIERIICNCDVFRASLSLHPMISLFGNCSRNMLSCMLLILHPGTVTLDF